MTVPYASCGASLVSVLGLVRECLTLPTTEAVVDRGIQYLERHGASICAPEEMSADTLAWLARDEEEVHLASLTRLYVSMMRAEMAGRKSPRSFLHGVAARYVRATEYLFPILHQFSATACHLTQMLDLPAYLFLRDALMFWPPALSLSNDGAPFHLLLYTRDQERTGAPPRVVDTSADSLIELPAADLSRALLVDAGLYGSLISSLISQGRCSPETAVLFLGSRNPFLAGWLNIHLTARMFAGTATDLSDVVCVVDTVESLFKPFRMPLTTEEKGGQTTIELAEPVTMMCSLVFLWSLYQFSLTERLRSTSNVEHALEGLARTKASLEPWFLFQPIPKWQAAHDFISTWRFGPLAPMHTICGFTSGLTTPPPARHDDDLAKREDD